MDLSLALEIQLIVSTLCFFLSSFRSVFNCTFLCYQCTLLSQYLFIFNAYTIFPGVSTFTEADDKVHCSINQHLMLIIWTSCRVWKSRANVLLKWCKKAQRRDTVNLFHRCRNHSRNVSCQKSVNNSVDLMKEVKMFRFISRLRQLFEQYKIQNYAV